MAQLRQLRQQRRISQLELWLRVGVSQRHLSCIDTGRAQPSREMLHALLDDGRTLLQAKRGTLAMKGLLGLPPALLAGGLNLLDALLRPGPVAGAARRPNTAGTVRTARTASATMGATARPRPLPGACAMPLPAPASAFASASASASIRLSAGPSARPPRPRPLAWARWPAALGLAWLGAWGGLGGAGLAQAASPAAAVVSGPQVAWLPAGSDADIDRALAQARAEKKPLLLYWGASWCPPCNHLKATLFNRADFIERSRALVPVHIDGDLPGAQKLGARFKVRGYPTMILMGADGSEITRLPGEVDAPQVLNVLQLGLSGGRPVKAVLADARAGKPISGPEWRMLAFYGWDIDEAQLVAAADRPALLAQLSAAAPASEAAAGTRLLLKALAESDDGKGLKADAALRQRVARLLADPAASRAQMDVLVNFARDISLALAPEPGADRRAVVAGFDAALVRLQADAGLSRADRLSALTSRVLLARIDAPRAERHPVLPAPLLQQLRAQVARDDQEIRDGHERQAVITSAAHVLGEAGLWADSDALLKANLARSHSPYYLMSQLGGNARKQGRPDEALQWYQQAFDRSEGPATRLQWGASYFGALVDLAPQDAARIERVARQLFGEAAKDPAAFHERSARSLQRVGSRLADWNKAGQHDAVLRRLREGPDGVAALCSRLDAADAQRGACEAVLKSVSARS